MFCMGINLSIGYTDKSIGEWVTYKYIAIIYNVSPILYWPKTNYCIRGKNGSTQF